LLFPILLFVACLLGVCNKGTPFFFQIRPGKNGKVFRIIKFKTMNNKRSENGMLLPDLARLTTVGAYVRRTSLDELPQLFNVLVGDMSLVGPRPLLVQYLTLYSKEQQRRHNVRPGITGWAQVNGRNAITWNEKFKFDIWYVENISLQLDLKILLLTFKKVIVKDGISSPTSITMEEFTGN
jgi:lipopolysaccharide/colanic/teichoic acid biosynthesis glycosyltransferase